MAPSLFAAMHASFEAVRLWAESQQNYVFAANQALHNCFLVWWAAAPWFLWLLERERRAGPPEDGHAAAEFLARARHRMAGVTFWALLLAMLSGANFGAIDWYLYKAFREIGPVPIAALAVKIALASLSLAILFYLRWILGRRLRDMPSDAPERAKLLGRQRLLWGVMMLLSPIVLAAAAVLRFTS